MFKSPKEYVAELVQAFNGHYGDAKQGLADAAKTYPRVPMLFWIDAAMELLKHEQEA